ncbi:hypothetical protein NDU88_007218 [Pleurodeles waltl]|uniref:Uncharacterized protein n=1 Tax=Pleurodeles waltl TaxID=8319 RepID=A0AAV7UN74_PLEWA|nr:hypothetical protein NDU88_007218 [Pleurodeles waltl]
MRRCSWRSEVLERSRPAGVRLSYGSPSEREAGRGVPSPRQRDAVAGEAKSWGDCVPRGRVSLMAVHVKEKPEGESRPPGTETL